MDQNGEQLTAALQKITKEEKENSVAYCAPPSEIAPIEIEGGDSIVAFVNANQAFAEQTRSVSVGTY